MRLVFMGTPNFAVPILQALLNDSFFQVIAVYTQPPKNSGRGQKLKYSPIYQLAEKHNIAIYHPVRLRDAAEQEKLFALKPEKIVVAAYGIILPKAIIDFCECINVHPSTLPRWRGAAPMHYTIMAGDESTSVCIMRMDEGMDTGPILAQKNYTLTQRENYDQLSHYLAEEGSLLICETLKNLRNITPIPQPEAGVEYASKLTAEKEHINWAMDAVVIERLIRALASKPGAFFYLGQERIKILAAEIIYQPHTYPAGTILDKDFAIACGRNILRPLILQREGKKPVMIKDFLNGFPILIGTQLG